MKLSTKIFSFTIGLSLCTSILASCGAPSGTQREITPGSPDTPGSPGEKTIFFQSAQTREYPLNRIMQSFVSYYNEHHKNDEGFIKVVYQDRTVTKATSEFNLATIISQKIQTKDPNIPQLIIGSLSSAYEINRNERLLEINQNDYFKNQPLIEKINDTTKTIIGLNNVSQSALPFDLTDLDALYFNKPVMQKLFDLFESGGGTIDKESNIYKKITTKTQVAADSFWAQVKLKNNEVFKGKTIDDSTFDNLESMFKFSKMIYDGFDLEKVKSMDNDNSILEIDYDRNVFLKHLWNKLGNKKETFLWTLQPDADKNNEFTVNFDNLKKEETKKVIKEVMQFWFDNAKVRRINNKYDFKSIRLNKGGSDGTLSFTRSRSSNLAFAIAPTVGLADSTISKDSIDKLTNGTNKTDAQKVKEADTKILSPNDVYWTHQVTKFDNTEKRTYEVGGSYLVPISSPDPEINKGTLNFMKYLYSGTFNNINLVDEIENQSGYFVPTKINWSKEVNDAKQKAFDEMQSTYNFSNVNEEQKINLYAKDYKNWDKYYYAQSGLITREGLKDILDNNKSDVSVIDFRNDADTSTISGYITKNVIEASTYNSKHKTPDEVIKQIEEKLEEING
ncbi:P68 family surface lipoprotein [Mycoplasma sp. E35C]|uniref:P68 family surface lipoprotein n=1 Tax=Mycoplasma sp. E35C TaxID=2801918 RepID=UPI001CA3B990|nr:P80 family lipoprotein [Mycoplasma sp. E35C]QZX49354.1 hypothetical protein JJE79_01220 [Mycoplasma sp. E35C]